MKEVQFNSENYNFYLEGYTYEKILDNAMADLFWNEDIISSISKFRESENRAEVSIAKFFGDFVGRKDRTDRDYQKLVVLLDKLPVIPYLYFMSLIVCNLSSTQFFPSLINEKFSESFKEIENESKLTIFASLLHYSLVFNKANYKFLTDNYPQETINTFMNRENIHNKHFVRFFSVSTVTTVLDSLCAIGLTKEQVKSFINLLSTNPNIKATAAIEKRLLEDSVSEEFILKKHGKTFKM